MNQYFDPVIQAMKRGDAIALRLAIDSPQQMMWFRSRWIHSVLKEKCIVILLRTLVRKTSVVWIPLRCMVHFIDATTFSVRIVQEMTHYKDQIPFHFFTSALRYSYDVDDGWGPEPVQAVLMSLIGQVCRV